MKLMEPLEPHGRYDVNDPYDNIGDRQYPHTGSDWNGVDAGYPAKAIGTGVVVNKQWHDGNGNTVTVRLPDGHYYAYLHLQEPASVTVGQTVTIGQVIGKVGNTGYNSHGAHLHITVTTGPQAYIGLPEQGRLDPWRFIQDHKGGTDPELPAEEEEEEENDMYLVRRIVDGNATLNGMTAAMGPGYFQHLGSGDLEGIARDLKIPDSRVIKGQETNGGNGLPAAEFSRLVSLFQIPAQYVKPGGRYLAGGSLNN